MSIDLGIKSLYVVVNKIKNAGEEKLVKENLKDFEIIGKMPYSESVRESDLKHFPPCESDAEFKKSIEDIAVKLESFHT